MTRTANAVLFHCTPDTILIVRRKKMIRIRKEHPQDIETIREVNVRAFGQAQEADIVDKLRHNCNDLLSLVAAVESRVVGHILFSPATLESEDGRVEGMGLAPMAVLPEYQKQGVGSELTRTGITELKCTGCPFVIVLGHAEYYPRFGFEPASRYGIRSEWEVPDEAFMILVLDNSVMEGISGVARYRPEFAEAT
ncbi:N-acetyltransferase [Acidobacteria bacterium AH-259-L09]|nr:N-acetyltransferase [Acidobacteria bacterium AH-259-L09]